MTERNSGILALVDWNSRKWQAPSTSEDLKHSNFGFVKENETSYTCLNFAQESYPVDEEGYYQGLLPQLWSKTPDKEKSKYVDVVFIRSHNWQDNQNYIVGLYAFPIFQKGKKHSPIDSFPGGIEVNIKALPKDIHLLDNYMNLNSYEKLDKFIPKGKKLGKQSYNYLTKDNVLEILDVMSKLNPKDSKLSGIKLRLLRSLI